MDTRVRRRHAPGNLGAGRRVVGVRLVCACALLGVGTPCGCARADRRARGVRPLVPGDPGRRRRPARRLVGPEGHGRQGDAAPEWPCVATPGWGPRTGPPPGAAPRPPRTAPRSGRSRTRRSAARRSGRARRDRAEPGRKPMPTPRWLSDRGSPGNHGARRGRDGEAPRAESGQSERRLRPTTVALPTWPRTAARSARPPHGRDAGRPYRSGSPRTPCLQRLQTATSSLSAHSTF